MALSDLTYSAKILLVDDKFDDDVQKAVTKLVEKQMPVQYWNGQDDFPDTIHNVRVIVLDLDLAGLGHHPSSISEYYPAARVLTKIPGPFAVVILAREFDEDDPSNLEKAYRELYNGQVPGFVADKGLSKGDVMEDPERLTSLVRAVVDEKKILDLLLLWEDSFDGAKDIAMKGLAKVEIENTILALVQSICQEVTGIEAAARELVDLMMRLVSRNVSQGKSFVRFQDLIRELNRASRPASQDPQLLNRLTFYNPEQNENLWTGDVYRIEEVQKFYRYAIALTPHCDLAQKKATSVLLCLAFPLKEDYLTDSEYPPYKIDHTVLRKASALASDSSKDSDQKTRELRDFVKERYFNYKTDLGLRFHRIKHFHDQGESIGICFDFNNVKSVPIEGIRASDRVCRLDSPFIEDMLQKYGAQSFRIGTPDWG